MKLETIKAFCESIYEPYETDKMYKSWDGHEYIYKTKVSSKTRYVRQLMELRAMIMDLIREVQ